LLAGNFSLQQANLVIANILAPVLLRLLDDGLAKLIHSGGKLILSGILAEQEGEMEKKLESQHLSIVEEERIDDWLGIAVQLK
jgi:ribosomal protein L11 methyltransferase